MESFSGIARRQRGYCCPHGMRQGPNTSATRYYAATNHYTASYNYTTTTSAADS